MAVVAAFGFCVGPLEAQQSWYRVLEASVWDGSSFGYDGAVTDVAVDGDLALVGFYGFDALPGSAHLFRRTDGLWAHVMRLQPASDEVPPGYGFRVALTGTTAAVAAAGSFEPDTEQVRVFKERADGTWPEVAVLRAATEGESLDKFGEALAADGSTIAVAARDHAVGDNGDAGVVYVFEEQADGQWTRQALLRSLDPGPDDWAFGVSLAMKDGTMAVGEWGFGGQVHLFRRDAGAWSFQTKLLSPNFERGGGFGDDVVLSDGFLSVLASREDDVVGLGRGRVYRYAGAGGALSLVATLAPPTGREIGWGLSADARHVVTQRFSFDWNGSTWDMQASPGDAPRRTLAGGSYFETVDEKSRWVTVHEFVGGEWVPTAELFPNDADPGDRKGAVLAMSGSMPVVGSAQKSDVGLRSGAVYSGKERIDLPGLSAGDEAGFSVGAADRYLAIGAPGDDGIGEDSGAVYVQGGGASLLQIEPRRGRAGDRFGTAVAMHREPDESWLFAGAPVADGDLGAVTAFTIASNTSFRERTTFSPQAETAARGFGSTIATGFFTNPQDMLFNVVAIGAPLGQGSVFTYQKRWSEGRTWTAGFEVEAPEDLADRGFGKAITVCDGLMAVGAPGDAESGDPGQVLLYEADVVRRPNDPEWKLLKRFPGDVSGFGAAVALLNRTSEFGHAERYLAVGSPQSSGGAGAVHVFTPNLAGEWESSLVLTSPQKWPDGGFGTAVVADHNWMFVGEPGASDPVPQVGAVHRFEIGLEQWSSQLDSYGEWLDRTFQLGPGAPELALSGDLDGDGVSNLFEYAFDMRIDEPQPNGQSVSRGGAGFPEFEVSQLPEGRASVRVRFVRQSREQSPGLRYYIESGSTLTDWEPVDLGAAVPVPGSDQSRYQYVQWEGVLGRSGSRALYLRFRVDYTSELE